MVLLYDMEDELMYSFGTANKFTKMVVVAKRQNKRRITLIRRDKTNATL